MLQLDRDCSSRVRWIWSIRKFGSPTFGTITWNRIWWKRSEKVFNCMADVLVPGLIRLRIFVVSWLSDWHSVECFWSRRLIKNIFKSETYPWTTNGSGSIPPLRLINAEDVGLEGGVTGNLDSQDPLVSESIVNLNFDEMWYDWDVNSIHSWICWCDYKRPQIIVVIRSKSPTVPVSIRI